MDNDVWNYEKFKSCFGDIKFMFWLAAINTSKFDPDIHVSHGNSPISMSVENRYSRVTEQELYNIPDIVWPKCNVFVECSYLIWRYEHSIYQDNESIKWDSAAEFLNSDITKRVFNMMCNRIYQQISDSVYTIFNMNGYSVDRPEEVLSVFKNSAELLIQMKNLESIHSLHKS